MKFIVQKYGGTSVNTKEKRENIINNVKEVISEGCMPVVVVSAMGRYPESYATDSLLSLVGDNPIDKRSLDLLSSLGENITTVVVSAELNAAGIKAMPLTGYQAGILTDENFGEGNILSIDTKRLEENAEKGIVSVVAGFQGMSENGEVLTLGRGGSDTTACALGGALKAERVEIFSDVDGVYTTDPKLSPKARLLEHIRFEDTFRLADCGAKVIHPRAVLHAMKANVPIHALNVGKKRGSICTIIEDIEKSPSFFAITGKKGEEKETITLLFDKDLIADNCEQIIKDILDEMNEEYFDFVKDDVSVMFYINKGNSQGVLKAIHDALIY